MDAWWHWALMVFGLGMTLRAGYLAGVRGDRARRALLELETREAERVRDETALAVKDAIESGRMSWTYTGASFNISTTVTPINRRW